MSKREDVITAVLGLVSAAAPGASVSRGEKPESIPPGGVIVVHDGDPGEPEIDLSPPTWNYSHRIHLEAAVHTDDPALRFAALAALLSPIGAAVAADRGLGGLCDFLTVEAPDTDDAELDGAEPSRWADLYIVADYATTDPLN